MKRRRSIAGPVLLSSLLAGLTGYWLGRSRVPPVAPQAPIVTMLSCPDPAAGGPPTADATTEPARHKASVVAAKPAGAQLPALEATQDHREQLLKYIRERSAGLQDCAAGQHERLRLTLRLDVGGQGAIQRVQVVDDDPDHAAIGQCVAQRMGTWRLPEEWVQAKQSLLRSVVL
jgi:hypothetical protein